MPSVREHVPAAAAVVGREDAELAADRVAEREAAPAAVEEVHAVVERGRIVVDEREPPAAAAVGGACRSATRRPRRSTARSRGARLAPRRRGTAARRVSGGETSCHVRAAVGRPQHLAVAAADPRDALVDRVEPAVLLVEPVGTGFQRGGRWWATAGAGSASASTRIRTTVWRMAVTLPAVRPRQTGRIRLRIPSIPPPITNNGRIRSGLVLRLPDGRRAPRAI